MKMKVKLPSFLGRNQGQPDEVTQQLPRPKPLPRRPKGHTPARHQRPLTPAEQRRIAGQQQRAAEEAAKRAAEEAAARKAKIAGLLGPLGGLVKGRALQPAPSKTIKLTPYPTRPSKQPQPARPAKKQQQPAPVQTDVPIAQGVPFLVRVKRLGLLLVAILLIALVAWSLLFGHSAAPSQQKSTPGLVPAATVQSVPGGTDCPGKLKAYPDPKNKSFWICVDK
jgi:hypothetical protein